MFGPSEGVIIGVVVIVVILFGGKKIPEIAKGLGKGIKEFKSAKNGLTDDEESKKAPDRLKDKSEPKSDDT